MGADFPEKAAATFKKSWDRARVALATADLFTRKPSEAKCTAAADIVGSTRLKVGEHLTVEAQGEGLVALRGIAEVARFPNPPTELLKAVQDSCGIAKGVVEQIHEMAAVAEISLC
jgi:hypothetical protein